jgi:hypothetical protein
VLAVGHLLGGSPDGAGDCARQQSKLCVGRRGRALDQRHGTNEAARQFQAADRKIVDCALRLRTPKCLGRDFEFTHAVAFSAE